MTTHITRRRTIGRLAPLATVAVVAAAFVPAGSPLAAPAGGAHRSTVGRSTSTGSRRDTSSSCTPATTSRHATRSSS